MHFRWSALALFILASVNAFADEPPPLKPGEVVAFVGGEEMLAVSETGEVERLLARQLPKHSLHFRDLAWEGDTVFEQHRDLNYPTLEQQLEKINATVVLAQFGQMESLAGPDRLGPFVDALEKLADRLTNRGKRRLVLVEPTGFEITSIAPDAWKKADTRIYRDAIKQLAQRRGYFYVECTPLRLEPGKKTNLRALPERPMITRDGVHLRASSLYVRAQSIAAALLGRTAAGSVDLPSATDNLLREKIAAKNRLWFHYRRPQNWAFLAGDRVTQPSSHDYRDPAKRWFPGEMEQFLPLIAAAELEIWKTAANASP